MAGRNEVTIDVVVREHGGKKVIKDVGDEARKTGTKFSETGKDAQKLGKEMFELEVKIRNASKEIKRTGDLDLDLAKTLRRNQSQLRSLTKLRNDLLGLGDDGGEVGRKAGTSLAGGVVDSFSKAMSSGGTTFVGAVVGAIAAAAPFIGANLAAAVVGTTGLGGIAGGIAMAARDPRVQNAAKDLGITFMHEFGQATEPFIAPTIDALGQLKGAVIDIAGKLAPEFAGLADHVAPLAHALIMMVENVLPGFRKALEAAQPVLGALERALPELGRDLSDMFEMMASDPQGAAAAMHDLFVIIGETAKGVGLLTGYLTSYYGMLIKVGEVSTGWANNLPEWLRAITPLSAVADFFDQSADAMDRAKEKAPHIETHLREIGDAATNTADELRGLKNAVDNVFSPIMDLDQATLRYEKGLLDLKEALTDGKRTLDIHTRAGQDNREAVLAQIEAIAGLRDATATVPEKVDEANAAYERQLEALRKTLLNLGYNKDEVNKLIDAYKGIPAQVTTEFRYPGLLEAIANFRKLAQLTGSNAAAARALGPGEGTFHQGGDTSGYGGGRASGGYMAPGMSYDVAESGTGVERVKMLRGGGAVVSNMGHWSAAGGGGATAVMARPVVNISVRPSGNAAMDALVQVLWPYILHQVSVEGGTLSAFGAA